MKKLLKILGLTLVSVAAVLLVLRVVWLDFAIVSGSDMMPGIKPDEFMVVKRTKEIQRGDLVLFRTKTDDMLIRRVIALPGEKFSMKGSLPIVEGRLAVQEKVRVLELNGRTYDVVRETLGGVSYEILDDRQRSVSDLKELQVQGGYWLLADNREHASDSRQDGAVPKERIRGVVLW